MRLLQRTMKLLRSRHGMTLSEVLIACALAVIVLGGASMIMCQAVKSQRDAEIMSFANNLAREEIEDLKALGYENIDPGTTSEVSDDGNYLLRTAIVDENDPDTGNPLRMKSITIEVYRNPPGEVVVPITAEGLQLLTTHTTFIHKRGL